MQEIILQVGPDALAGLSLAREMNAKGIRTSVLLDSSGGRGITPESWPDLPQGLSCGFAGGLGPNNLQKKLAELHDVVGDADIWVDMESGVRADDGRTLDLNKVRTCLEVAAEHVK